MDNARLAPEMYALLRAFTDNNFMHVIVLLIEIIMLFAPLGHKNVIMEKM